MSEIEVNGGAWMWIGMGIFAFLVCAGMGTCSMLDKADVKINVNQNVELK